MYYPTTLIDFEFCIVQQVQRFMIHIILSLP